MNDQVAAYSGLVESLARKHSSGPRAAQVGAEYDDLYQEGLISIWQALERGVTPSAEMVENRMRDWARYLGRQTPIPYEALLPLEDYPSGEARV
jgi:DNA-directed RNA polymerase specialized sigma24 family protein